MAAPTVRYFAVSSGTDAALVRIWATKLHELLLDAGWSIEYADSDAIGGGSSGSPAWDKTPTTNTSAGNAVYRMPANDHATRWYVRIQPGWGSSTSASRHFMTLRAGTGHSSGTLSGVVSTEISTGNVLTNGKDLAWQMGVSEDGFMIAQASGTNLYAQIVERLRLADGVSDDLFLWSSAGPAATIVSASSGTVSDANPRAMGAVTLSGPGSDAASLTGRDGSELCIVGPYPLGGTPLAQPPRLAVIVQATDVSASAYREMQIDGGSKTYQAAASTGPGSSMRLLVATE